SRAGVQINGARDVRLTGCTIRANQSIGVQMSSATHVTMIESNISATFGVFGTVDRGIFANNNVVISADAAAQGRGIALTGRRNLVANNSIVLQGSGSLPNHDDIGIVVTDHSQVRGNIINQFFYGIELSGEFNQVVENLITGRLGASGMPP